MSLFGPIVDGDQVEQACLAMLQLRFPTYIDEIAEQRGHEKGRGAYKYPPHKSYSTVNDFHKWPEEVLPAVLLISPGMVDEPVRRGNGSYTGVWYIATAVVVSARTEKATRTLAMRYGAALRACMLQNKSLEGALGGKARVIKWVSEDYDDVDADDSRTLAAAKNIFHVQVDDVVNIFDGPREWLEDVPSGPDKPNEEETPPYGELPTIDPEKLSIDVTYKEDDE